jgi:hypothetical protein
MAGTHCPTVKSRLYTQLNRSQKSGTFRVHDFANHRNSARLNATLESAENVDMEPKRGGMHGSAKQREKGERQQQVAGSNPVWRTVQTPTVTRLQGFSHIRLLHTEA